GGGDARVHLYVRSGCLLETGRGHRDTIRAGGERGDEPVTFFIGDRLERLGRSRIHDDNFSLGNKSALGGFYQSVQGSAEGLSQRRRREGEQLERHAAVLHCGTPSFSPGGSKGAQTRYPWWLDGQPHTPSSGFRARWNHHTPDSWIMRSLGSGSVSSRVTHQGTAVPQTRCTTRRRSQVTSARNAQQPTCDFQSP